MVIPPFKDTLVEVRKGPTQGTEEILGLHNRAGVRVSSEEVRSDADSGELLFLTRKPMPS